MSVEELIIDDELPQQITEDLITDQDLHEKER